MKHWAAILVSAFSLVSAAVCGEADSTLDIYWVDVEGGAATLLVTPGGESVLVDSGMPSRLGRALSHHDPERIHRVAAGVAGLKRIDHLVTTHFHLDHFGGAPELAERIPIGRLYDCGIPDRDPDGNPQNDAGFARQIQPYREMKVEERVMLKAGDLIPLRQSEGKPRLTLQCLAAQQRLLAPAAGQTASNALCATLVRKDKDSSDNANSVALLLEFGPFRFFNGADLTWNVEAGLVCPINLVGTVDVYQVDHHGFDISNNPVLVRSLAPTVTVMLNGTEKGCGPGTVSLLRSLPSAQANYQMHRNLRADGANTTDEYIANQQAQCSAHYIKLAVAPSGQAYTVSIPGTGHRKTFKTRPL